jgi:hypothetical protein
MSRWRAALLAGLLIAAGGPAVAREGLTTDSNDFTIEAHPETWRGRPVVAGRVYNKRSVQATHVQLRVEALDQAGNVIAGAVRFLDRDINPGDRVYFQVTPPAEASTYRVSVQYVSWQPGGGSGGGGGGM